MCHDPLAQPAWSSKRTKTEIEDSASKAKVRSEVVTTETEMVTTETEVVTMETKKELRKVLAPISTNTIGTVQPPKQKFAGIDA